MIIIIELKLILDGELMPTTTRVNFPSSEVCQIFGEHILPEAVAVTGVTVPHLRSPPEILIEIIVKSDVTILQSDSVLHTAEVLMLNGYR